QVESSAQKTDLGLGSSSCNGETVGAALVLPYQDTVGIGIIVSIIAHCEGRHAGGPRPHNTYYTVIVVLGSACRLIRNGLERDLHIGWTIEFGQWGRDEVTSIIGFAQFYKSWSCIDHFLVAGKGVFGTCPATSHFLFGPAVHTCF